MERNAENMPICARGGGIVNKRGAILHWILFGVLLAFGVFFLASKTEFISIQPKAEWQLNFLQQNYLEAEKWILKTNIIARAEGIEIARELAQQGGFAAAVPSECGTVENNNLWNKGEENCFPDVSAAAVELARSKLNSQFPGKTFTAMGFKDTFFYGKGPKESIGTKDAFYTFENSFYVNIGYSFSEYNQIQQEAQSLLAICTENIAACLTEKKPAHWHYRSCTDEPEIPTDATEMVFCVESPGEYKIDGKRVEYMLALDFASESIGEVPNVS